MRTNAVVIEAPKRLSLSTVELTGAEETDILVDVAWSGISGGTERLLWSGTMPAFPGMGYPLIPGYEAVGEVLQAGEKSGLEPGDKVFVPGARCFTDARSLFGGQAKRLVTHGARALKLQADAGSEAVLMALAATARHALRDPQTSDGPVLPDLIVGHGVLGRLLARIAVAEGGSPLVWETNAKRRDGAEGYQVIDPQDDDRRDYTRIMDASGDPAVLDRIIQRLGYGGEVVLAGFYAHSLSFAFPAAFMREARLRIAAEWKPKDLEAVGALVASGALSLTGLISHFSDASDAEEAYRAAAEDRDCLKMTLDWRSIT
jgi:bacteriochlorophyllide a dehydrogenase